jgi:hypothetical protein
MCITMKCTNHKAESRCLGTVTKFAVLNGFLKRTPDVVSTAYIFSHFVHQPIYDRQGVFGSEMKAKLVALIKMEKIRTARRS